MDNVIPPPRYAVYACSGIDLPYEPSVLEQVKACRAAARKANPDSILIQDGIFIDIVSCHNCGLRPGLDGLWRVESPAFKHLLITKSAHGSLSKNYVNLLGEILEDFGAELRIVPDPPRRKARRAGRGAGLSAPMR